MTRTEADKWLHVRRPVTAPRVRLVCLPYAGGGSTVYSAWDALATDIEVCAVQLPGRQERWKEQCLTDVATIVDHLVEALAARAPIPIALYGHSFGGLVAFELALRLQARSEPPIAVVVGGRPAPQTPMRHAPIRDLPHDAFAKAIHVRYGTPIEVLRDPDLMEMVIPPLRADLAALETYVFSERQKLQTSVTALRGQLDLSHDRPTVDAWQAVTTLPLAVHEIDGGHFFVDSHRRWVQARVADAISRGFDA